MWVWYYTTQIKKINNTPSGMPLFIGQMTVNWPLIGFTHTSVIWLKPWCILYRLCTSATIFARGRATLRISQNRRTNEHVITRACTYLSYNIIIFYYYQRLLNLPICTNNKIPFARENLSHRPPGMCFCSDIILYYNIIVPTTRIIFDII